MATLREVAALAGVSTATVSRVFSRPDAVLPQTRDRIMQAAADLDYVPNTAARSLARGRTGNLGLLVPDIANPVFASVITSVQDCAQENGHVLFVAAGNGRAEDEFALVQAIARQVDGLVLTAPRMSDAELDEVAKLAPLILVNRQWREIPAVLLPSGDGMAEAVDHLADLGHRDIAYLGGPPSHLTQQHRLDAFVATCARRGVTGHVLGEHEPDFATAGESAAEKVMASGARAVIAFNDQIAVGLLKGLSPHGFRAGRDISVIGFDDSWLAELIDPPLTTVRMPFPAAGRTALRLLLDTLDGRSVEDDSVVEFATHLIVRGSTTAPPAL